MDEHDENQEEGAGSMPVHSVSDISELEISTIAADTTEPDLTESISTSISVQTDSLITKPVGSQTSWYRRHYGVQVKYTTPMKNRSTQCEIKASSIRFSKSTQTQMADIQPQSDLKNNVDIGTQCSLCACKEEGDTEEDMDVDDLDFEDDPADENYSPYTEDMDEVKDDDDEEDKWLFDQQYLQMH
ncbi:uncharacterized protein LOC143030711 [Oratosquilla oratoria]|uniref:uncharacterized protein LOC143030711 n=1 Tax=Oratosquilla oratoria TaxID=337810 RepID=UPI003F7660BA